MLDVDLERQTTLMQNQTELATAQNTLLAAYIYQLDDPTGFGRMIGIGLANGLTPALLAEMLVDNANNEVFEAAFEEHRDRRGRTKDIDHDVAVRLHFGGFGRENGDIEECSHARSMPDSWHAGICCYPHD